MKRYKFIYCSVCGSGHQGLRRSAKRVCRDVRCVRGRFKQPLDRVGTMAEADRIREKWREMKRAERDAE